MQQYFIDAHCFNDDTATIIGPDVHHIKNVMRMKPQQTVKIVVEKTAYLAEITEITQEHILLKIVEQLTKARELPVQISIALGLLKQDKLEYALQKLTELGMYQFIPWQAKYSIVKIDAQKQDKKTKRWEAILKEAAEQSQRLVIPNLCGPKTTTELCNLFSQYDKVYVAYEQLAVEEAKIHYSGQEQSILIIIGPEGGIAQTEIDLMKSCPNVSFITLGARILRAETAAIFSMSVIGSAFENLILKG
ncbi:MAG: RsmE family RNA methyltransferase [Culicoidibacterales bacterium]